MKYIKSTYKILALYVLNRDADESWAIWALDMLSAGFESDQLILLAGISKPYNQFYLRELTARAFAELSLDTSSLEKALNDYTLYLVEDALAGNLSYSAVLAELKDIFNELHQISFLSPFYLLYFAEDDLKFSRHQFYWPGATRQNIQETISEYFRDWVRGHKYESQLAG
jgi:hypothetical protein